MIEKPMLATAAKNTAELPWPMVATPKIDGIRCLMRGGQAVSRSLKPIKNDHIRTTLEALLPDGVDGELFAGSTFQEATSAVMRKKGEPAFSYAVFDLVTDPHVPYNVRLERLAHLVLEVCDDRIQMVPHLLVHSEEELLAYEARCLEQGFEGVMLRTPTSPYKYGRATLRQAWLLKLKRFADAEAVVLSVEEAMHNTNEAKKNALGHTERSTAKAGKVPAGRLGAFVVQDQATGLQFNIGGGPGLTLALRQELWEQRAGLVGRLVKYRYQPTGVKEAPRFPQFLGFRDEEDTDGQG